VADLYAEELVAAGGAALTTASVLAMCEPLLQVLATTPDKVFFARALKGSVKVLPQLLKASCPGVELGAVQARLFAMAADPTTLDRYRAELYATHGLFQTATGQRNTLATAAVTPKNPAALKAEDGESSDSQEDEDEEDDEDEEGDEEEDEADNGEEMDDDEESDDEEDSEAEEESEEEAPPLPLSQKGAKSGAAQAASVGSAKRKASADEASVGGALRRRVSFGANQSLDHVASIKALKQARSLLSPSPKRGILATRVATPGKALKKVEAASPKVAPTSAKNKSATLSTPRHKASDFF
jgi:hypothetical protein